jgi:hypothetical protein
MYTGKLRHDIDTLPRIVAETVGECMPNSVYLLKRLKYIYRSNPRWGKLLYRDCQRSPMMLYQFMNHWLAGWLVREKVITPSQALEMQFRPQQMNMEVIK